MNKIKRFFWFLGTSNWHEGVDKPTFYQYIYKWRVGIKLAWRLA